MLILFYTVTNLILHNHNRQTFGKTHQEKKQKAQVNKMKI